MNEYVHRYNICNDFASQLLHHSIGIVQAIHIHHHNNNKKDNVVVEIPNAFVLSPYVHHPHHPSTYIKNHNNNNDDDDDNVNHDEVDETTIVLPTNENSIPLNVLLDMDFFIQSIEEQYGIKARLVPLPGSASLPSPSSTLLPASAYANQIPPPCIGIREMSMEDATIISSILKLFRPSSILNDLILKDAMNQLLILLPSHNDNLKKNNNDDKSETETDERRLENGVCVHSPIEWNDCPGLGGGVRNANENENENDEIQLQTYHCLQQKQKQKQKQKQTKAKATNSNGNSEPQESILDIFENRALHSPNRWVAIIGGGGGGGGGGGKDEEEEEDETMTNQIVKELSSSPYTVMISPISKMVQELMKQNEFQSKLFIPNVLLRDQDQDQDRDQEYDYDYSKYFMTNLLELLEFMICSEFPHFIGDSTSLWSALQIAIRQNTDITSSPSSSIASTAVSTTSTTTTSGTNNYRETFWYNRHYYHQHHYQKKERKGGTGGSAGGGIIPLQSILPMFPIPIVYTYTEMSSTSGKYLLRASISSVRKHMPNVPIHILYHEHDDKNNKNKKHHDDDDDDDDDNDNDESDYEFQSWLIDQNVIIHHHNPSWRDQIETMRKNGNIETSHLFQHAGNYFGTWQRIDIPLFVFTEYAILLDSDTIVVRPFSMSDLNRTMMMTTMEGGGGGMQSVAFSAESKLKDPIPWNAGVALMNLPYLKKTYDDFCSFILQHIHGEPYKPNAPSDQGAYLDYYKDTIQYLDIKFNYKPYYEVVRYFSQDTIIVHFHGVKPNQYVNHFVGESCGNKAVQTLCDVAERSTNLCKTVQEFAKSLVLASGGGLEDVAKYCYYTYNKGHEVDKEEDADNDATSQEEFCLDIFTYLAEGDDCVDLKEAIHHVRPHQPLLGSRKSSSSSSSSSSSRFTSRNGSEELSDWNVLGDEEGLNWSLLLFPLSWIGVVVLCVYFGFRLKRRHYYY